MRYRAFVAVLGAIVLAMPVAAMAAGVDVSVSPTDITLAPALLSYPPETAVRVYVRIHNNGQEDTVASAALSVDGVAIGQASPVPVRAGGSAEAWGDWGVPSEPFRITAAVSAVGDGQQRNNRAQTDEYAVVAPAGRDIFSPPPGREGVIPTSSIGLIATGTEAVATDTTPVTSPTVPVTYTAPAASVADDSAPLEDYSWIPYVLIALGAIGFAWGMRGRRSTMSRPAATIAVPASKARAPRRRPVKVYRPAVVVEKSGSKPRRAPRRRPPTPAAPTA